MKVRAVKSTIESDEILPGAQFADAFSLVVDDVRLDARSAATRSTRPATTCWR